MDFSFDEGERATQELARKIFAQRVTPAALKAVEATSDRIDRSLWGELGTAGLLGVAIPEAHGGGGVGFIGLCALMAEAGASVAKVPLYPSLVLGGLAVAEFGTDEQRAALLPGVASGAIILSGALVEEGMSDPFAPATHAVKSGRGYVLTGVKTCVPVAELARKILVVAKVDAGLGVFLVDPKAKGVSLERQATTTGDPVHRMTLSEVAVAPEDVLGEVGHGKKVLDWLLPRATVALCAMELGVTEHVLRMTAEYTTGRHQFDRPIATFQALSQRMADAYIDVETIRVTTWHAAFRLLKGLPAAQAVTIAKYWAAEAGHRVAYTAQHLHGGMGYDLDYPLHRYYVLSKELEITLGSATVQIARLGALLAGSDAAGAALTGGE